MNYGEVDETNIMDLLRGVDGTYSVLTPQRHHKLGNGNFATV